MKRPGNSSESSSRIPTSPPLDNVSIGNSRTIATSVFNIRCMQPRHAREVVVAKTGFASNRKKTKDSESSTASGPTGNTSRLARKPVALISSFHSALPGLNVEQWAVWSNRSLARRDLSLVTVVETVSSLASPTDGSESDNHSDRSCGSCTTPPERVSTLGEVRLGFTHVRLDVKQLDRHRGRHHRLAVQTFKLEII